MHMDKTDLSKDKLVGHITQTVYRDKQISYMINNLVLEKEILLIML